MSHGILLTGTSDFIQITGTSDIISQTNVVHVSGGVVGGKSKSVGRKLKESPVFIKPTVRVEGLSFGRINTKTVNFVHSSTHVLWKNHTESKVEPFSVRSGVTESKMVLSINNNVNAELYHVSKENAHYMVFNEMNKIKKLLELQSLLKMID